MDSMVKIYSKRAANEVQTATALFELSTSILIKEQLHIEQDSTFYSAGISHSYYAIFYSAKALLLTKNIKTESPNIHKNTYELFKIEFVDSGILDLELLKIYNNMIIRADELLQIFKEEKWKRGNFTYYTISDANKLPAKESVENAKKFVRNIMQIIEKSS
ncbi:HEPN domain-containing protein [Candidatus Woesearchaeota archaeon]|nr:HEPN domain-containing protein [Candidatus Woesearchaeota archaeon]